MKKIVFPLIALLFSFPALAELFPCEQKTCIIIKIDDFTDPESSNMSDLIDTLTNTEGVPVNVGVVTQNLEGSPGAPYLSALATYEADPDVELFDHGYSGAKYQDKTKAEQLILFNKSKDLFAANSLTYVGFGAPGNKVDQAMYDALAEMPNIKVWLYSGGFEAPPPAVRANGRCNIEYEVGNSRDIVTNEALTTEINRCLTVVAPGNNDTLILQFHPGTHSYPTELTQIQAAIDAFQALNSDGNAANDVQFLRISDYYTIKSGGSSGGGGGSPGGSAGGAVLWSSDFNNVNFSAMMDPDTGDLKCKDTCPTLVDGGADDYVRFQTNWATVIGSEHGHRSEFNFRDKDIGSVPIGDHRWIGYRFRLVNWFDDDEITYPSGAHGGSTSILQLYASPRTFSITGAEIDFTNANSSVNEGDTLSKGGVTAKINYLIVETGTLASGTNTGKMYITVPSGGNFSAGAATSTGGGSLTLDGAQSAVNNRKCKFGSAFGANPITFLTDHTQLHSPMKVNVKGTLTGTSVPWDGDWHRLVIHAKPDKTSGGVVEVWLDDTKIVDFTGQTQPFPDGCGNDPGPPDWQLGIYKWKWKTSSSIATAGIVTMDLDDLTVASAADGVNAYAVVDPDGTEVVESTPTNLFSDDFSTTKAGWTEVDPLGDTPVSVTGGKLTFAVPSGSTHHYWESNKNAVRYMQAVNSDTLQIDTKIEATFDTNAQMAGILIRGSGDNDVITYRIVHNGTQYQLSLDTFVSNTAANVASADFGSTIPAYLRVKRESGNVWTFSYSTDGTTFTNIASPFTHSLALTQAGLFAANVSTNPAVNASFDYFIVDGSDVVPPVISNIAVEQTDTTAKITWDTNEAAATVLDYGLTTGYGTNVTKSNSVTSHEVVLTGLTAETEYNFRIDATDSSTNQTLSSNQTFTTTAALVTTLVSDTFDADTGIWTEVDDRGDITISTANGRFAASVPAGVTHDFYSTDLSALRYVQTTNNANFTVETKLLKSMSFIVQMAGLVIEEDEGNIIRFGASYTSSGYRINLLSFNSGALTVHQNIVVGTSFPSYLRATKSGTQYTFEYSSDGVTWTAVTPIDHTMIVGRVGLFAGSTGTNPGYDAEFDYFLVNGQSICDSTYIGYWDMTDADAQPLPDISCNNRSGTFKGGAQWQTGKRSVRFDGQDGYINLGNVPLNSANLSMSSWFYLDNGSQCKYGICAIVDKGDIFNLGVIGMSNGYRVRVKATVGGSVFAAQSGLLKQPEGRWIHAAVTHDGSTLKLYVDGKEESSIPAVGTIDTSAEEMWLGGKFGKYPKLNFDGEVGKTFFKNTLFDAATVKQLASQR